MKNALGLIEVKGLTAAIIAADAMAKTADVAVAGIENTKGLGWMTVKVTGDVGAVNAAVAAGRQAVGGAGGYFISATVIARPSDPVETVFCAAGAPEKEAVPVEEDRSLEIGAPVEAAPETGLPQEEEPKSEGENVPDASGDGLLTGDLPAGDLLTDDMAAPVEAKRPSEAAPEETIPPEAQVPPEEESMNENQPAGLEKVKPLTALPGKKETARKTAAAKQGKKEKA